MKDSMIEKLSQLFKEKYDQSNDWDSYISSIGLTQVQFENLHYAIDQILELLNSRKETIGIRDPAWESDPKWFNYPDVSEPSKVGLIFMPEEFALKVLVLGRLPS
jgi:hypothetical protein